MKKLLLTIAMAALCCSHVSAQSIRLNASSLQQKLTLMGGDMERSAGFLDQASNAQEIANWVFRDIAFTTCRVSYDKQQELTEGAPNFAFYNGAVSAMLKVKAARSGIKFWGTLKSDYDGYGTENNLPNWIYTGGGYNGGSYDPTKLNTTKYARFLADYLRYMNQKGVPLAYLSVSKEWKQVLTPDNEKKTIDALKTLLATSAYSGVPVPLFVGPAGWGVVGSTGFVDSVIAKGYTSRYHGFSTHDYDTPTEAEWSDFIDTVATTGKKCWNDESNSGSGGPTYGVEPDISVPIGTYTKHAVWYRQGLQGELFFEQWSRGIAKETRSIYFLAGQPGVRLRGYYIMKHFADQAADANYLSATVSSLPGVEVMVFRKGATIRMWVMNSSATTYSNVPITLTGTTLSSTTIARHHWNATTNVLGVDTSFNRTSTTKFINSLTPTAIITYTFNVN